MSSKNTYTTRLGTGYLDVKIRQTAETFNQFQLQSRGDTKFLRYIFKITLSAMRYAPGGERVIIENSTDVMYYLMSHDACEAIISEAGKGVSGVVAGVLALNAPFGFGQGEGA